MSGVPFRILLAVSLVATVVLAAFEYVRQGREETQRDLQLAAAVAAAMERTVEGTLAASSTALALADEGGTIPPDLFDRFARAVVAQPGVASVAWERYVPRADLADVEAALETQVWERSPDGSSVPVGRREAYLPVVRAWPGEYAEIVGYDLLSEPVRAEAALAARDLGSPVVTAPVLLAPAQRAGVLVVVPLYVPGMPAATPEQRREAFSGAVTVAHLATSFLAHMVLQPRMRMRVTDAGQLVAQTVPPPPPGEGAEVLTQVGGRTWTLQVRHPRRASLVNVGWILAMGFGLALAIGWSLRQTTSHVQEVAEARNQLARMLSAVQEGSLRAPATPPAGVDIAVRYLPAAEHARLGGDWYDVLAPDDGRVIITVGDVSGHGIDAITHMQQVRQVIASFAFEGHSPATVLRLADDVLRHEPMVSGHFATVWLGYLDRRRHTLRYASAGHPPALLSLPDSKATPLDTEPGPPLNLPLAGARWEDHAVELAAGATLLVYTDGLVESRTDGIDAGVPFACTLVSEQDQPLDALADRLIAAQPDPGRDDAAFILARIGTP